VGNGCSHNLLHLGQNLAERGELKEAAALQEWLAQALIDLDNRPANRGLALYNLACFYATTGQAAKALPLVKESLSLREDLREWSQQDSDLDSLREMAEFKTLYS
jgi:tetratricopeptide (TPR) repeat protein